MIAKLQEIKKTEILVDYDHFYVADNDDSLEDYFEDVTEMVKKFSARNPEVFTSKFDVETKSNFDKTPWIETGYFVLLTNKRVTLEQKYQIAKQIVEIMNSDFDCDLVLATGNGDFEY